MLTDLKAKIAHVSPTYFSPASVLGGGERYVDYVARSVGLVSPSISQKIIGCGPKPHVFDRNGIAVKVLKDISGSNDPMEAQPEGLWEELRDVDLVHIHQSLTRFGAFAMVVAKTLRKPVVLTDLGGAQDRTMLGGGGQELADAVVSISRHAASLVAPYYHGRHEVILGPLDTDFFAPADLDQPLGRDVLSVARILPHKGFDQIIDALPPGLNLTIVGSLYDQRYYDDLVEMARGKAVRFRHQVDDEQLRELYAQSGLYIQASTHCDMYGRFSDRPELLGLTTLEAMSCGLPVVVSSAASLPELATDPRVTAVFRDRGELRCLLERFRDGIWPTVSSRAIARNLAVGTYGLQKVGGRLLALYEDLILAARC
jgi:glycosyltransferase involved in cell wall biosynthesis